MSTDTEEGLYVPRPDTPVPKVICFDLDDTVWYPELYMLSGGAPFTRDSDGRVYDRRGEEMLVYPAARQALELIHTHPSFEGTKAVFASRTNRREWAFECMGLLEVAKGVTLQDTAAQCEIYAGSKRAHFAQIRKRSGVAFDEQLFFDNEGINCREVSQLGVVCVHCVGGMSAQFWEEGLRAYAESRAHVGA